MLLGLSVPCVPDSQGPQAVAGPASPHLGAAAGCRGDTGHRSASSAAAGADWGKKRRAATIRLVCVGEPLIGSTHYHYHYLEVGEQHTFQQIYTVLSLGRFTVSHTAFF